MAVTADSAPADLHIKAVAAGDIDGDGDMDLWVESTGGWNITSHFMLNRGDGRRFEVDSVRAPKVLLHNPPAVQSISAFDLDGDGLRHHPSTARAARSAHGRPGCAHRGRAPEPDGVVGRLQIRSGPKAPVAG